MIVFNIRRARGDDDIIQALIVQILRDHNDWQTPRRKCHCRCQAIADKPWIGSARSAKPSAIRVRPEGAVFSNINTLVAFQTSGEDADYLTNGLDQKVDPPDLVNLPPLRATSRPCGCGMPPTVKWSLRCAEMRRWKPSRSVQTARCWRPLKQQHRKPQR